MTQKPILLTLCSVSLSLSFCFVYKYIYIYIYIFMTLRQRVIIFANSLPFEPQKSRQGQHFFLSHLLLFTRTKRESRSSPSLMGSAVVPEPEP